MAPNIGGNFTYFTTEANERSVKLTDFNAKISFNRGSEEYNNSIIIANNETQVEKHNNRPSKIKVTSNHEMPVLNNIFNFDKEAKTFSQKDYEILLSNVGETIKLENCAYKIKASKEEIAQGIINIHLCDKLADGTARSVGKSFTIDIETKEEMQNGKTLAKQETSLVVNWKENEKIKTRTISFKGNFGFKIDGKTYKVEKGKVYDESGKEIEALELNKTDAYQFIGMSNFAEKAKDNTFSKKEIEEAEYKSGAHGVSHCNPDISQAVGYGVTGGNENQVSLYYDNGVFTSEIMKPERKWWGGYDYVSNKVSVWMNN